MKYLLFFIAAIISKTLSAQEDMWGVYMAQYDKGRGSVLVNLSLYDRGPGLPLEYIVMTGVQVNDCDSDGFPASEEFGKLHEISDSIVSKVKTLVQAELCGTFTYQCNRSVYIYVKDTNGLRDLINQTYRKYFPEYMATTQISEDKKWSTYLDYLYPTEEAQETMINQDIVGQLMAAGDDLSEPRHVDHFLYFDTDAGRDSFLTAVGSMNFKIESEEYDNTLPKPFALHLSRVDLVDLYSISAVTLTLRQQAPLWGGVYDGWETIIIKKK